VKECAVQLTRSRSLLVSDLEDDNNSKKIEVNVVHVRKSTPDPYKGITYKYNSDEIEVAIDRYNKYRTKSDEGDYS
jgi:hypothetical protein